MANHKVLMVLKKNYFIIQSKYSICIPLTGPLVVGVVVVEVVNLIPLGLIYSLLFVVVCGNGLFISCDCCSPSIIVVDGSFV